MARPKIVLFGDSITQRSFEPGGWGAALTNTFSRKADVIVRGYGGYNTKLALFLLDETFPTNCTKPPVAVTVFFGANDAALLGRNNEQQHVPIAQYKENLLKIVYHIKESIPAVLVVLITPPPVDEVGRIEYARSLYGENAKPPERTNEMAGMYAKTCMEVAAELNVPSINLWSKMQETPDWQKYLCDGLHLTEEGNAVVHREVVKVLASGGLHAPGMPYDFPHHSQIDFEKPEEAFKKQR
ncbi:hypothetical protein AMTRI_Chr03g141750 [Amborella trichopoda]